MDIEKGRFRAVHEKQKPGIARRDLARQFGTNGTACSGYHHGPSLQRLAYLMPKQFDRFTAQQIRDVEVAYEPDTDTVMHQLPHARNDPDSYWHAFADC